MIGTSARIVEINKLYLDINIIGNFLIVRNNDRPGIVGAVGTALGNAGANIANLSLARNSQENNALTMIELDSPVSTEIMEEIQGIAGVTQATGITL